MNLMSERLAWGEIQVLKAWIMQHCKGDYRSDSEQHHL